MKIFLDTADTKTISKHFETGLIDGVTTNPTLIMKSHERPDDVYRDLVLMGLKDISMEVVGTRGEMLEEADRLISNSMMRSQSKCHVHRMALRSVRTCMLKVLELMSH